MKGVNHTDPVPAKQPFLVLTVVQVPCECGKANCSEQWQIEVGGKIDRFITKAKRPTALLMRLCRLLKAGGFVVRGFGSYKGSAGPSHVYRQGVLYARMDKVLETAGLDDPDPEGKSVEVDSPTHIPPW